MKKRIFSLLLVLVLLTGLLPVSAAAQSSAFSDVFTSDYYYEPVDWAVKNEITSGVGGGLFGPNQSCTRGQIVTFLWRSSGSPAPASSYNPFSDVSPQDYYYHAVLWAVEQGITSGIGGGLFGPNQSCTRGQVATFLWRSKGSPAPGSPSNPFSDVYPHDYYYNAVLWAVEQGVTSGVGGGMFGPNQTCTRGQIVTFLYRAVANDSTPTPTPAPTPSPSPSPAPDDEQKEFVPKTIHDFPEELVINFDEDETTNFGVLNETVIRWENSNITAEKIYDGEESRYVFSDEQAVAGVPLGSVVFVRGADGTPYLVSFGSVDGNIVTPAKDLPLSAYYTYLDAAIVTEIDTAAMERGSVATYALRQTRSNGVTFSPNLKGGVTVGTVIDSEYFKVGITGDITCKSDGHIKYDAVFWGEDYIDFMLESSLSYSATVTGEAKFSETLRSLNEDLEIGEVPLVTIVPGLDLTLEAKLPVKLDAKVGFTAGLEVSRTERVEYMNHFAKPVHTTVEDKSDVTVDCKGEVNLKAGLAAEIGVDFLDDLLELVLELKLLGVVSGTPEFPDRDFSDKPKSVHMCSSCIRGQLLGELSGELKFQANISKKTKLELVTLTLVKLEIPVDAFYVSLESPEDSVHEGKISFGLGSCPNHKWRVSFITRLFDGSLLTESYIVEITSENLEETLVAISTENAYLYDGQYTAAMERDGEMGRPADFTVKGFPEEVTLFASKGTEKEIYTSYLLNGGYEALVGNMLQYGELDEHSVKTVLGDFDGNGIQDLLLEYTSVYWGGSAAANPVYGALYTIDKETEEVVVVTTFWHGQPNATRPNESLAFRRNTKTGEHPLVLSVTQYLNESNSCSIKTETVQRLEGQRLVSGDSYREEQFLWYLDEENEFEDAIEAIKKGPHTFLEADNDGRTYHFIKAYYINDVAVSKEVYDESYPYLGAITDSAYKWHSGGYYTPIK